MKKITVFSILYIFAFIAFGQSKDERANTPVPFTLADRDRLIKLEVQVEALDDKIDTEIGSLRREIDSLCREMDSVRSLMYIIIAGIFGLIGFTVWDRRTFHLKLEKRIEALEKPPLVYSPK